MTTTKPARVLSAAALFLGIHFSVSSVPLHAQEGDNVAELGVATQSTTGFDLGPELALDGDFDTFTHTETGVGPSWWEVDLGEEFDVAFIVLHNRAAGAIGGSRLRDVTVIIRDSGDEEVFRSALLNPENALGGGTTSGPPSLTLNLVELTGGEVAGQFVRVERTPDPDLSGTGGQGNEDEPDVLSLAEVEVVSGCPTDGDTHCEEMFITGPPDGGPGEYAVEVIADDDSGGTILYTFRAEHGVAGTVVVGPQQDTIAFLTLGRPGVWEISVTVDDSLVCGDEANDATCSEEIEVSPSDNLALTGVATQSTTGFDLGPELALDGDLDTFSHTESNGPDAWWEVDLLEEFDLAFIEIKNRAMGGAGGSRLRDITVTIRDAADQVVFESPLLNSENVLGAGLSGPPSLTLDLNTLEGAPVTGQVVRVARTPDEDLSGTGGADGGHTGDEAFILNIAEVDVFQACGDDPKEGDTACDSMDIFGPPESAPGVFEPGLFEITAFGTDVGGDPTLFYTFLADDGQGTRFIVGPQEDSFASFELGPGTWTLSVTVNDSLRCTDTIPGATCSEEVVVAIDCDDAGDTHCESISIQGPAAGGPGVYVVTATAFDDSGDTILYTFTADNGVDDPTVRGPQESNSASLTLGGGAWEISVLADGDPFCPEEAPDARCGPEEIQIAAPQRNLALDGIATQSTDYQLGDLPASNAIDDDLNSISHTESGVGPAWWEVALDQEYDIGLMVFRNRGGGNLGGSRLRDVTVTIRDAGDTVVFDSGLLNQENALGGGTLAGPESIIVDPVALTGGVVTGQTVRITRTPDPDFSGTGGNTGGNDADESHILNLTEVEIYETGDDCPAQGDTVCEDIVIDGPLDELGFVYEVTAEGSDAGADLPLYYTFTAQNGDELITFGPMEANVATFQLFVGGTWTIAVNVDDDLRCADLAAGAECSEEIDVEGIDCDDAGDAHCEELIFDPPIGEQNLPGLYTITAIADDDTGDPISYLFTANNGRGQILSKGPQEEDNVATFDLGMGTWEISVTVDDNPFCLEEAPDATCVEEIHVGEGDPEVALTGVASQSSTLSDNAGTHSAERAIDGDLGNFTHTEPGVNLPSTWELDLVQDYQISRIVLHNRGGGQTGGSRLRDITVSILDAAGTVVFESDLLNPENELGAVLNGPALLSVDLLGETGNRVAGRVVRVERTPDPDLSGTFGLGNPDEPDVLSLAEVEVFAREGVVIPKGVGPFLRGDCDGNGTFGGSPTEAIVLLNFSFRGGPAPPCLAACDAEANGSLGITDGLRILRAAFLGQGDPDPPFPDCEVSQLASDLDLGCENPFCDN